MGEIHGQSHDNLLGMYSIMLSTGLFTVNDVHNMTQLTMKLFDHPNVMTLIGVCVSIGGGPAIIMPYMENGSLLSYLRKDKKNITASDYQDLETVSYTLLLLLWSGKLNFTFNFNFWLYLLTLAIEIDSKLMRIYAFRCIILLKSCWACKCINWQCHYWSECNQ